MSLEYVKHEKISLRQHPTLNEKWLHDRIADDPTILGLGEIRLLDRERPIPGGGRIDLLLLDDESNSRYEVEIQLGATDPSHIIRCIEYWDMERRRYPGYDHIAVIIAEDITSRFLNVMSLLAGSIPMRAIQLDALKIGEKLVLSFSQVLDQTELRLDDTDEEDGGGGQVDRAYWDKKASSELMKVCDDVVTVINQKASNPQELNYLQGYIGLRSNGVVNNFIHMAPKRTKNFTHLVFRNSNAAEWKDRFDEAGIPASSKRKTRLRISVNPSEYREKLPLIRELIDETVQEFES